MENDLNKAVDKQAKAKVEEIKRRIRSCFNPLFPPCQMPPQGKQGCADEFWNTESRLPDTSGNVIRSVLDIVADLGDGDGGNPFHQVSYKSQWRSDVLGHFAKAIGFAFNCSTDDNGNLSCKIKEEMRKEVIEGMMNAGVRPERKTVTITGNDIEVEHE